jgi:hypothetical protein
MAGHWGRQQCTRDFGLLATADIAFAQLYPRSDGTGVEIVGSPVVDVLGWSTADGAQGVALTAGRRADNRVISSLQLASREACVVGVTGSKVCIGTSGVGAATWLLVFADAAEMGSFLAFLAAKGIAAERAERYSRPKPPGLGARLAELLADEHQVVALLEGLVVTPGWAALVERIALMANSHGIDLQGASANGGN